MTPRIYTRADIIALIDEAVERQLRSYGICSEDEPEDDYWVVTHAEKSDPLPLPRGVLHPDNVVPLRRR